MNQKKHTSTICRQQEDIFAGFFWSDITLQKFEIKSNGKVIKTFMGKVFVPKPVILSELNILSMHADQLGRNAVKSLEEMGL